MQQPTCIHIYFAKNNNPQSIRIKIFFFFERERIEVHTFFIFRNSSLPTNRSNVTVLLTTSTEPTEGKNEQLHVTVLIAVTLLCVFLIISMTVNIFLLSTKRCKNYTALHQLTAIYFI